MIYLLSRLPALSATCVLLFAALLSSTSAFSQVAANANKDSTAQAVSYMKANGFSAESIQGVLVIANFSTEKRVAAGATPEEDVMIKMVQPVKPDGSGLEQILSGGNKLPKKSFWEVTRQDKLTADNYSKVVDALFDPADMDTWLTKPDGSAMNAQERADQKEALVNSKSRWVSKYPDLVKTGKQEIADKWLSNFNALVQKAIHGSREEFRRGLIAAHTMASYSTVPQDKLNLFAPATVTQVAEMILMRDPSPQMVQIERSVSSTGRDRTTLKYLVASNVSLAGVGFPEGVGATQLALKTWHENQAEIAQSEAKIAQSEAKIAQSEAKTALIKKINNLANQILKQNEELNTKKSDTAFVRTLYAKLDAIQLASQELKEWEKLNPHHPGNAELRKQVDELVALLRSTTTTNALGYGITPPKGQ